MAIDNFGIAFANKVARRTWQDAVFPGIVNRDYEGQVKEFGDRLRILMFLAAGGALDDYVAGTDMNVEALYDDESTLVIEKRKNWNFPIDRLEEVFTYAGDVADSLVEIKQRRLAEELDTYVLSFAGNAKVGSHVGYDMRVTSNDATATEASIATTSTGGTISINAESPTAANHVATVELGDGTLAFSGFTAADTGKGIRLLSGTTWATPFYRISAVTDSVTVSVTNWDEATAGSEIPNGDILRGLGGAIEYTGGAFNTDGKTTTERGWGWEIQAAFATTIASGSVYEQVTELDRRLNENEIPSDDRHLVGPPAFTMTLKQSSELGNGLALMQAYEGVILNAKVGKVGGFMVHEAAGMRVSTRTTHATSTGIGADIVVSTGSLAYQIPAWHRSFCTFAYKWSESRTVDAEKQFAKLYQGLHLYGAVVPLVRRRAGALLFGAL